MLQKFNLEEHKQFKKKMGIRDKQSDYEKEFYKKTEKYLKFIKWTPGLKMIGIVNSISMNSSTKNSDIDLFIVTSVKKMWFVRILVTIIFQFLGVRKHGKKHTGRFCLSFFATTDGLDFSEFALEKDPYLYFWIIYLKPILNYDNTYEKFLKQNNSWADFFEYNDFFEENKSFIKYKLSHPGIPSLKTKGRRQQKKDEKKNIFDNLWNFFDKIFKKIFLPKTMKNYEKLGKPYGIIINDNMLKFHNNDVRKEIKEN